MEHRPSNNMSGRVHAMERDVRGGAQGGNTLPNGDVEVGGGGLVSAKLLLRCGILVGTETRVVITRGEGAWGGGQGNVWRV